MRWLTVGIVCWTAAALAGTTDDAIPDAAYLRYAAGFRPYTAQVSGLLAENDKVFTASGVAIADRYVLTAAHVAAPAGTCIVTLGERSLRVTRIHVHPEWQDGRLGHDDIALLETAEAIGLAWYPPLSDGGEEPGSVCSIAGYGVSGPISTGYAVSDGRLRAGTNTVARFERGVIVCLISRGSSPMEFGIGPGDSGGPLFISGRLAGINSFTMADAPPLRSRSGEESGHTRVSLHREWIKGIVGR